MALGHRAWGAETADGGRVREAGTADGGRARERVVVLRALGLGDLLTAVPALRALARAFPSHERVLAAPGALVPLAALIDAGNQPAVHRVVDVAEMTALPAELHRAAVAVNLHGRGPQSHRIVAAARPKKPIWFAHPDIPESAGAPRWRPDEHEVARWCRLLAESGIPADRTDLKLRTDGLQAPAWARGATLIHPGAASPARRWPPDRFAAVARAQRARGVHVVLTGTAPERSLAEFVARAAGLDPSAVHAGDTDLATLAAAVAHAGCVVCGDTGVAHMATALGTPSVVLFGPTSPETWGPPADAARHIVLWAGRTGDPHGRRPDPGLLEITVADVMQALERLPDASARSRERSAGAPDATARSPDGSARARAAAAHAREPA